MGLPWRPISVRRLLVVLATAVLFAACSSGHKPVTPPPSTTTSTTAQIITQEQADRACRQATTNFVNAQPTTVGAIHAITGGPSRGGKPPYAWILKNAPPQETVAWCWYQPTPHRFKLIVVAASGEVVHSGQVSNGGGPPRPGPLAVI